MPFIDLLRNLILNFDSKKRNAIENVFKRKTHFELCIAPVQRRSRTSIHSSVWGYDAILLQQDAEDRMFHPVYYASCKTTPVEEKYPS